jgi:S1-C subfamily serine protease
LLAAPYNTTSRPIEAEPVSATWTCDRKHRWSIADGSATVDWSPVCPECGSAGRPADENETLPPAGDPLPVPSLADVRVPGYELLAELGRGAMGVVYRARDEKLGRPVALKMILAGGHASASDRARFKREAEAVAALRHPNIVQIYAVGETGGLPFCALEFIEGGNLADQAGRKPLPPTQAAQLVEQLARAVHFAHEHGIVHRDLKPANVLLDADGTPRIADFGLAKKVDSATGPTVPGAVLGTPAYMAPEQAGGEGKTVGPAADTYALGVILYELLTGRPPFRGATQVDTILQVISAEPRPPRSVNPTVPRDLETVTLKCLRKEPEKRYATTAELADDLRRWRAGEPVAARPLGRGERLWRATKRRRGWLIAAGPLASALLIVVLVPRDKPAGETPPPPPTPPKAAEPPARPRAVRRGDPAPETINRVKESVAQIRVTRSGPRAYGSGWVADRNGDEAVVVTNAHVVGMLEPARQPPKKIEVLLHAGTSRERHFEGSLLGVDRDENLAVIRIKGGDLPGALPIVPSSDVEQSQKLLCFGFPSGFFLRQGPVTTTVKIRQVSVSGLVFRPNGSVKYIQLEGGSDPGNSGGPIVDGNGNVIAILVEGDPGSNLRWAIPSEFVVALLDGRMQEIQPGQAIRLDARAKQPLSAVVADPLRRLRRVEGAVWTGRPGKLRAASSTRPPLRDGDGPAVAVAFDYNRDRHAPVGEGQTVTGELTLPPLGKDQVYWFRPHYETSDGRERWGEAVPLDIGRFPVDALPARLAATMTPAEGPADVRRVRISNQQRSGFEIEAIQVKSRADYGADVVLDEQTAERAPNGDAKIRIDCKSLRVDGSDLDAITRRSMAGVLEAIKDLRAHATVTSDGHWLTVVPDFATVAPTDRPVLRGYAGPAFQTLSGLSVPLPGREVNPGETWGCPMPWELNIQNTPKEVLVAMTVKYVGRRVRAGREEAVVELTGGVASSGPDEKKPGDEDRGLAQGAALIDLATGHVTLATARADFDIPVPLAVDIEGLKATGTVRCGVRLFMALRRSLTPHDPEAVDVATLLPKQPVILSPFVAFRPPDLSPAPPP